MPKEARTEHTIDADGKAPGRLAAAIVPLLIGKHKVSYTPNKDEGDTVRIVHVDRMHWSGRKLDQKVYRHYTGYPGGLRTKQAKVVEQEKPGDSLRRAVSRMLPKNSFRSSRLKRLIIE